MLAYLELFEVCSSPLTSILRSIDAVPPTSPIRILTTNTCRNLIEPNLITYTLFIDVFNSVSDIVVELIRM